MQMMPPWTTDSTIYALIIVVTILGLISIYLSYMVLTELKEMRAAIERVGKLLESVE